MPFFRYRDDQILNTQLHPFDDAVDWLAGLQSISHLTSVLRSTRSLNEEVARTRARRGTYFAGIACDFIEATRTGKPHVAFLPAYYAVLNLSKLVIACSDRSEEVEGGIHHGVSYGVDHKDSHSLFTEELRLHTGGVFPILYQVLTGRNLPVRPTKRHRRIALREVYERLFDVSAEYSRCEGVLASPICIVSSPCPVTLEGEPPRRVMTIQIESANHNPIDEGRFLPPFPRWHRDPSNSRRWISPPQVLPSARSPLNLETAIDRCYFLPPLPANEHVTRFILPVGRLVFTEELPIFLAFYHLSSIVRYKPRFLETIQDSDAWPVVLAARRHLLYRAILNTLSYVFCANMRVTVR